jgi:hypothetical protein
MNFSSAPDAVKRLTDGLTTNGAQVRLVHEVSAFNQVVDFLVPDGLSLRVTTDRGQWFVEVGKQAWNDWFDADVWKAAKDDEPVPLQPSDAGWQAVWFYENWTFLTTAKSHDLLQGLLERRTYRAYKRLGLRRDAE